MKSLGRFMLASLAALAVSGSVLAGPVSSFAGSAGLFSSTPTTFATAAGGLIDTFTTQPGPPVVNPLSNFTLSAVNYTLTSVTGVPVTNAGDAGTGTLSFGAGQNLVLTPTSGPGSVTFSLDPAATFTLTGPIAPIPSSRFSFVNVTGSMVLTSNTTLSDFGPLGVVWSWKPTFTASNGITATNGTPGSLVFSGSVGRSVSAESTFVNRNTPGVPEPATLATFGLLGLTGLVARRKMKKTVA